VCTSQGLTRRMCVARQGAGGRTQKGDCRRKNGRPACGEEAGGRHHHRRHLPAHVSPFRTLQTGARKQSLRMGNSKCCARRSTRFAHRLAQIPGTKRVDHRRAVKMYERAAGDKTLPSDLRPPVILKESVPRGFLRLDSLFLYFRKHSTISSMTSSAVLASPRPIRLSAIVHAPSAMTLQCNTSPVKSPSSVTIVVHDSISSLSTLSETNPAFQSPSRNSNS